MTDKHPNSLTSQGLAQRPGPTLALTVPNRIRLQLPTLGTWWAMHLYGFLPSLSRVLTPPPVFWNSLPNKLLVHESSFHSLLLGECT